MTIRPGDRPRSIAAWLATFDDPKATRRSAAVEIDEDATRFAAFDKMADEIVPVAPPADTAGEKIETRVPTDPNEVEFNRAGQVTNASKKVAVTSAPPAEVAEAEPVAAPPPATTPSPVSATQKPITTPTPAKPASRTLLVGGAAALVVAVAGGWALLGGRDQSGEANAPVLSTKVDGIPRPVAGPARVPEVETLAPDLKTLADEARKAGAPDAATARLDSVGAELATQLESLRPLANDPAKAVGLGTRVTAMKALATTANRDLAAAVLAATEAKARRLSTALPWASPLAANAARGEPADRQAAAASLRAALDGVRSAAATAAGATDPAQAIAAARQSLAQSQAFGAASALAYRREAAADRAAAATLLASKAAATAKLPRAVAAPVAAVAAAALAPSASGPVASSKVGQVYAIVGEGRRMASQVMRSGSPENVQLARGYDRYLATLKDSMRGVRSDREADRLIAQAKQTRAYLQYLVKQSGER